MSTSNSEHNPSVLALKPALRDPRLLLVPHPADEISQFMVLSYIVEAGRYWHVNDWTGLEFDTSTDTDVVKTSCE